MVIGNMRSVGRLLFFLPTLLAFYLSFSSVIAYAQVVAYPRVEGRPASTTYSMTVNGQSIPVQQYNGISFAWFAFSGTANVKVSVNQVVSSYRLSPIRNGVLSAVNGTDITFTLSQPRKLVLHKVNGLTEQLFILADPLESNPPVLGASGVVNVQNYSNGTTDWSTGIQRAIDAAAALPTGGVAYVPPGLYNITSSIFLKSNVNLYLAPGAVIRMFPGSYTSSVGFPITQVSNAKITGRGVIHGRGSEGGSSYVHVLHTNQANNVTIKDVMFLDGLTTQIRLGASTAFVIDNVKILSGSASLSDGIDITDGSNITLSNNFVYSSDDNVAFLSGTNVFNYGVPAPTDGVQIRGNIFHHPSTGYCCYGHIVDIVPWRGTSYNKNIVFDNNDAIWAKDVFGVFPFGGTNVDTITYRNSSIEEVAGRPFIFAAVDCTSWGPLNCGQPAGVLGYIHNVRVDTLTFVNLSAAQASSFVGFSSLADINIVTFNNLRMGGKLIGDAAGGNISIGSFVYNVSFGSVDTIGPLAPTGLRIN
jgi:hypothetical protein